MQKERINQLFNSKDAVLAVCVGSWFAYTSCNSHALGSFYEGRFFINFDELESAEELEDLLRSIGWSDQELEELFIQDYESATLSFSNCDYINPLALARVYCEVRDQIQDESAKAAALLEAGIISLNSAEDLQELADSLDNYIFYENMTGPEYMEEITEEAGNIPDNLKYYIDYAAMWRDESLSGYADEVAGGVLIYC